MNHLDFILDAVARHGSHEERWHALRSAYFRGPDGFEQIEAWAQAHGLTVSFSDERQTCWFHRASADQSK